MTRIAPHPAGADGPAAVVVHPCVTPDAPPDEQDTLVEARQVCEALEQCGVRTQCVGVTLDLERMLREIESVRPDIVFNLVESLDGDDALQHLAPAVLESRGYRLTGSCSQAILITTDKRLSKRILAYNGIATPPWCTGLDVVEGHIGFEPPYFVKRNSEEASRGIDDESVIGSKQQLIARFRDMEHEAALRWLVEKYVDGREFNISILEENGKPRVLTPVEIRFVDFPPGKPRIVGYAAKWDAGSFEFRNTVRQLTPAPQDAALTAELSRLSVECWHALSLRGYARIDFRVDAEGCPFVLEANANPCLARDAGLVAAAQADGISYRELIQRIVAVAGMVLPRP